MLDFRSYQVAPRGDREIYGTREFAAPRVLVWEAYTKPELLKKWMLGPPWYNMAVIAMNSLCACVGGRLAVR